MAAEAGPIPRWEVARVTCVPGDPALYWWTSGRRSCLSQLSLHRVQGVRGSVPNEWGRSCVP